MTVPTALKFRKEACTKKNIAATNTNRQHSTKQRIAQSLISTTSLLKEVLSLVLGTRGPKIASAPWCSQMRAWTRSTLHWWARSTKALILYPTACQYSSKAWDQMLQSEQAKTWITCRVKSVQFAKSIAKKSVNSSLKETDNLLDWEFKWNKSRWTLSGCKPITDKSSLISKRRTPSCDFKLHSWVGFWAFK